MGTFLFLLLLFSGLCSLSSCVPRQFHVVKGEKTWTEAQQYCRDEFTDLATIGNMTEMKMLNSTINEAGVADAWIGLKQGSNPKWQWSLADRDFYREDEAEFRKWDSDQPQGTNKKCTVMERGDEEWHNHQCNSNKPFICYDGGNSTPPYVLVTDGKNWADAQRYCREKHTDLASVRNQTENEEIKEVIGSADEAWIGLFRDAWEWSDGSTSSFRHWGTGEPNNGDSSDGFCAQITSTGQWNDVGCDHLSNFICYEDVTTATTPAAVTNPAPTTPNLSSEGVLPSTSPAPTTPDKLVLVRENKTWIEALQYCREHHVDLVSVTSEEIQRWVRGRAKGASSTHVWMGLRHSCMGFWFWVNGEAVCFNNWAQGEETEPDCNAGGGCQSARVGAVESGGDGEGEWVILPETEELNFICTNEDE